VRPYLEKTLHKKRGGGVAQGVGPEFKSQYHTKKVKMEAILKRPYGCYSITVKFPIVAMFFSFIIFIVHSEVLTEEMT
jgi:hypothetical protein